jgi:acyl carrier protein
MNAAVDPIVRHLLAVRLETPLEGIDADQELQRDLGLDPLDLVLLALDLEETYRAEFPMAELELVRTVGDLSTLARAWREANRPERAARPLPESVAVLRRRLRRATREWQIAKVAPPSSRLRVAYRRTST